MTNKVQKQQYCVCKKYFAIANRSHISCAQNTSIASVCLITHDI